MWLLRASQSNRVHYTADKYQAYVMKIFVKLQRSNICTLDSQAQTSLVPLIAIKGSSECAGFISVYFPLGIVEENQNGWHIHV